MLVVICDKYETSSQGVADASDQTQQDGQDFSIFFTVCLFDYLLSSSMVSHDFIYNTEPL